MGKETQEEKGAEESVLNFLIDHGFNVERILQETVYQVPMEEPKFRAFKTGF